MKSIFLISFYFLFIGTFVNCQDVEFSQFFNNPVNTNPGYVGSEEYVRICMNYRNSYPFSANLRNAFVTYSASYDQPVHFIHGGIGLHFQKDIQAEGMFSNTWIEAIYSYHIQLSKEFYMNAALGFSVMQNGFDASNVILPDMIDIQSGIITSEEALTSSSHLFMDYSIGFVGFYKNINVGAGINHLTQPSALGNNYDYELKRKYSFIYSQDITLGKSYSQKELYAIKPLILFQKQDKMHQLEWGAITKINVTRYGLLVRHNLRPNIDAVIIYLGITYNNIIFGYSYDLNIPNATSRPPISGKHEVALQIKLHLLEKSSRPKTIKCPKV